MSALYRGWRLFYAYRSFLKQIWAIPAASGRYPAIIRSESISAGKRPGIKKFWKFFCALHRGGLELSNAPLTKSISPKATILKRSTWSMPKSEILPKILDGWIPPKVSGFGGIFDFDSEIALLELWQWFKVQNGSKIVKLSDGEIFGPLRNFYTRRNF